MKRVTNVGLHACVSLVYAYIRYNYPQPMLLKILISTVNV